MPIGALACAIPVAGGGEREPGPANDSDVAGPARGVRLLLVVFYRGWDRRDGLLVL